MSLLRISHLTFRAGSKPGTSPLSVDIPHVTVLVGPNNSGKSITLRELELWCQGQNPSFKVLASANLIWPDSYADLLTMIKVHEAPPPANQMPSPDHFWVSRPVIRQGEGELHDQIVEKSLKNWFDKSSDQPLRQVFVKLFTLRLDGRTRFDLVDSKDTGHWKHRRATIYGLCLSVIAAEKRSDNSPKMRLEDIS